MVKNVHNVFVYGTLKSGFGNNYLLREGGAEYVALCETHWGYVFFDGGFPYLAKLDEVPGVIPVGHAAPVCGELWRCNDDTLRSLDQLEGVPHHYRRESIPVITSTGIKTTAGAYIWQRPNPKHRPFIKPNKANRLVWPTEIGRARMELAFSRYKS